MIRVLVGTEGKGERLRWEAAGMEELVSMASTPALLGGARAFVLRGALMGERGGDFLELLEVFVESPHEFIFEEEKLLKAEREALARAGAKIEEVKKEKKEYRFDRFGAGSALAARDRKRLWLAVAASLRAGEEPEALAGLLAWQARRMGDAALSRALVRLYHDSHRGAGELALLLERFALGV